MLKRKDRRNLLKDLRAPIIHSLRSRSVCSAGFSAAPPASPYSSPPFPLGERWGPVMGTPDTAPDSYPLMRTLQGTQVARPALPAASESTSGSIHRLMSVRPTIQTFPLSYTIDSNSVHLDQVIVRIERGLDTISKAVWIGDCDSRTCIRSIIDGPHRKGS